MNLCPFHTEVYVNMCRPVCMRRSVCTKSNSIARVRCPWLLFTTPNFHPRSQDLLSVVDPENHRSLVSTYIPTGWLNTTVQFSWIRGYLGKRQNATNYTASIQRQTPIPTSSVLPSHFIQRKWQAWRVSLELKWAQVRHLGLPLTQAASGGASTF